MKKLFLLAATATMMFASCSKTDVIYQDETPQEIGLFSVAKNPTKAAIEGTTFSHGNMMVAAYLSAGVGVAPGVYFTNAPFTGSGSSYTGGKYWPIQESNINFFAVAPQVSDQVATTFTLGTGENANKGIATVEVTNNQENQHDIMYAVGQGHKTTATPNPLVGMVFNHALAMIDFKFTGNNTITINSVTVNGAMYNGTLTITSNNWTSNTAQAATIVGWSGNTKVDNIEIPATADLTLDNTSKRYGTTGLLVRPCDATSIVINYTVTAGGDTHTYNYTFDPSEWVAGKKYTYNVSMSLSEIVINPSIVDWGTGTTEGITIN